MKKTEKILIGILLFILIPVSFFFLGWWFSAIIYLIKVFPINSLIMTNLPFICLGIGFIITVSFITNFIKKFYSVDLRLLIFIFLGWSFIVLAFFMGLPVGNLLLGSVAGIYIGRKIYHQNKDNGISNDITIKTAYLTSFVTAGLSIFVGILSSFKYVLLIILVSIILGVIQYFLTRFCIKTAVSL